MYSYVFKDELSNNKGKNNMFWNNCYDFKMNYFHLNMKGKTPLPP